METPNPNFRERVVHTIDTAPFIRDIGMRLDDCGPGWCRTHLPVEERHWQQNGFVHAGVQGTVADHTAGCAGLTLVQADQAVLTIEFKLNLLRPAIGESLLCRAEVLRPGRSVIVAESWVEAVADGQSRLCAKATVTVAAVPIT